MALNIDISGRNILEVDYERYAEGEAVLGWLNCSASLTGRNVDWDKFAASLMNEMADRFKALRVSTGHVKLIVENGDLYISANLAGSSEKPVFRWSAGKSDNAEMIVNARVVMEPEELEKVFRNSLQIVTNFDIKVKINRIRSIKPGYPNPTHRYTSKTE